MANSSSSEVIAVSSPLFAGSWVLFSPEFGELWSGSANSRGNMAIAKPAADLARLSSSSELTLVCSALSNSGNANGVVLVIELLGI